jgi:hypothetical protein
MIINDATVIAELTELAERYEVALMANDLSALDAMFWQSRDVVRLGVGENLYGIEEIAAFRAKRPGGSTSPAKSASRIIAVGIGIASPNSTATGWRRWPSPPRASPGRT